MGNYNKKITRGIIWVIWWALKGSILVGIITRRIKDKKKRDFIVIAFDIAVILVFIWWTLNERTSYIQGYTDTLNMVCGKYVIDFCPNWEKMKNMSLNDISNWNRTGTELPAIIQVKMNLTRYCDGGNITKCF